MDRPLTLITGGTRGIGAAAEEARLAAEDAGARCLVVRADVTDPAG